MVSVRKLTGWSRDIEAMTKMGTQTSKSSALCRRSVLMTGLAALLVGGVVDPAEAQRGRRRMRRMRRMRRRAIRRLHRRGDGLPDRARGAIRRGEIRPLRDVIARVRQRSNAEILDVDLHQNGGAWVYGLRVLTPNGRVRDVFVDGRSLEVLDLKDKSVGDGVPLPPNLMPPNAQRPPPPLERLPNSRQYPPSRQSIPPPVRRPR